MNKTEYIGGFFDKDTKIKGYVFLADFFNSIAEGYEVLDFWVVENEYVIKVKKLC